jgi:predicted O-methyltransferase YrrM
MSNKTINLTDRLYKYMLSVSLREPEIMRHLREETAKDPMVQMQIAPEQGQFMALLVELLQAEKTLEIGVYTGYSSLCVAMALPSEGKLVACDVSEEWTRVAQRYWQEAGVREKIDLRLGPAIQTLNELMQQGEAGTFDFVFIDADKENDQAYYESSLALLRPGGLVAIDNVFWDGQVADPQVQDEDTLAIRELNQTLLNDRRISLSVVPIADGLTLGMKRRL